jgi:hypothetical protein
LGDDGSEEKSAGEQTAHGLRITGGFRSP